MSIVKKNFLIFICCVISVSVWGQAARSPFSTFGIGEFYSNSLAHQHGMAGVGVSHPQVWFLNNQNPALLVYNNFTVFEAGLVGERRTITGNSVTEKITGGNLNYLVTAFPVKPTRWTTSLGLMPFTTVNYRFEYNNEIAGSTSTAKITEEGDGGITQLYWSNGVRIYKDLSLGLKAAYLFGSLVNTYKNELEELSQISFVAAIEEKSYVKDFAFSAGLSFSKDSLFRNDRYRLSFGSVVDFGTDLNTLERNTFYRINSAGDVINADTLDASSGKIYLPPAYTAGISLSRDLKWSIGAEFSTRDWSSFKSVNRDDEGLGKSWRFSLGGEVTPDAFAIDKFMKRITYRIGASMEQYPFLANNKSVKDIGINFGLSVPSGRSNLNAAFKFGKRGNKSENILEENYFKIYFGITFNDTWFIKHKVD